MKSSTCSSKMIRFVTGLLILTFRLIPSKGQLSSRETLNTDTFCDVSSMSLDCTSDSIAIQSVTFAYDPACESTCCSHDSNHCMENAESDDTEYLRRACSGHQSCSFDLSGDRSFCALGTKPPSYATVYYQCVPHARISSVCTSSTLSSDGSPLYLTNENYPSVTTGDSTCSCSLEVYACSSNIKMFIIDADLYHDEANCNQRLGFLDGTNASLKDINCESFYGSPVVNEVLNTHYITINFLDGATQDQEGYFFLGFEASDTNTQFSLSCTAAAESWCVDCGALQSITFGSIDLDDPGNSGYQAEATVNCNPGHQASSPKVSCLENATWEIASCSLKDCGSPSNISFGTLELDDPGNTLYRANASVTCDSGYETNSQKITCLESATWEVAVCSLEDNNTENESDNDDKEKNNDGTGNGGGLSSSIIAAIVVGVVVCVAAIAVSAYCILHRKNKTITSVGVDVERSQLRNQPNTKTVVHADAEYIEPKKPQPDSIRKHEIKHGHIYVDHGEAHIFAFTINLPFAGHSANRMEPIVRSTTVEKRMVKRREQRKRRKKHKKTKTTDYFI